MENRLLFTFLLLFWAIYFLQGGVLALLFAVGAQGNGRPHHTTQGNACRAKGVLGAGGQGLP